MEQIIQRLESEYHATGSDTVLYSAQIYWKEKAITGYWKKVEGRGRPKADVSRIGQSGNLKLRI